MERTVPKSATDEIDLYLRTIYSLLRSTTEVQIRTLEEVHAGMNSSLHPDARKVTPDTSAFIYTSLRLPTCIMETRSIVLGQSAQLFARHGYPEVENWQPVSARARRRRSYFDGNNTLAVFIASRSDIEDIVPTLTAFQIEWNKMHQLLQVWNPPSWEEVGVESSPAFMELSRVLGILPEDLQRLASVWGGDFSAILKKIAKRRCSFGIRLLSGSLSEYWRATRMWWHNIERNTPLLGERPVYFISSNTHSIPNLLSGYALTRKEQILAFLQQQDNQELLAEWQEIQECGNCASTENFLYYALKKYQQTAHGAVENIQMAREEQSHGITRVPATHSFDIEAQVVDLCKLDPERFDPRLLPDDRNAAFLSKSNALIVNRDYP